MFCMRGRCSIGIIHIFCGGIHYLNMKEISFEDFLKQIRPKMRQISALEGRKWNNLEYFGIG